MQMVLVLGATSKVSNSYSLPNKSCLLLLAAQGVISCALDGCAQRNAISVHFFVVAGDFWYESVLVGNGNASFAVSCKLSWGPVRWHGCETATGRPRQHHQVKIVCRDVLALMDRVSQVNGLELVGDMPMSLLASKA